jgi:hypothetical protein
MYKLMEESTLYIGIKNPEKQARHWILEEIDLVLCLEHCTLWLRYLDTKKNRAEVFGELWNVVLEKNGQDKMARGSKLIKKFLNV